ncbi:MAG: DnaJ domain-containing protein [Magnetococcus sp. MYC-9]
MKGQQEDYYQILGIEQTASQEEIKRAFRTLARQYHPDVSRLADGGAQFKKVAAAYEALKTDTQRAEYDARHAWQQHADLTEFATDMESLLRAWLATLSTPLSTYAISISPEEALRGNARLFRLPTPRGRERLIKIHIPPGVTDGQRIRFHVKSGGGGKTPDVMHIKIKIIHAQSSTPSGHDHAGRTTIDR